MEAEFVLGGPHGPDLVDESPLPSKQGDETEENASPLLEARAIVKMLASSRPCDRYSTCNKVLWVTLLQRLLRNDRLLLGALHSQADCEHEVIFLCRDVVEKLLESDVEMLDDERGYYGSHHCHNKRLSPSDEWFIPSSRVIIDLLRAFPGEESFSFPSYSPTGNQAVLWSLDRTILSMPRWDNYLRVCSILMCDLCSSDEMAAPWIDTCIQLWEQLVAAVANPRVAKEILWEADESLRQHSETPQVGLEMFFQPLLSVLSRLKCRHESMGIDKPVMELGYQVPALLLAQSYRLDNLVRSQKKVFRFDLHSKYLEKIFLSYLGARQSQAWQNTYFPWATAIVKINAAEDP